MFLTSSSIFTISRPEPFTYINQSINQSINQPTNQPFNCGVWWLIGRFVAFNPKGRRFESHSSCHVGTLGKSFTRSCLQLFSVKLQHSIHAVSGAPLSSSGLEEALLKSFISWNGKCIDTSTIEVTNYNGDSTKP